ncbi:hypothetical protein HY487_01535 [Candidatus Woesearchaeota archaeon]|nr:hypothetical protein [Candidatus Woesearchaeota archaeon]
MKIKISPLIAFLIITALAIVGCGTSGNSATASAQYDSFAKCLSADGVKMYGAYWCPHCSSQKQMFGNSFKFINYIECSLPDRAGQTKACTDAKINAYPTWEFADGKRIEGELSFEQLSRNSNCKIEEK